MAEPVPFPQANMRMLPPPGDKECMELPICRTTVDGQPVNISCWQLTKPEIEELMKTGKIWLWVFGQGHPPVSISAKYPFQE